MKMINKNYLELVQKGFITLEDAERTCIYLGPFDEWIEQGGC